MTANGHDATEKSLFQLTRELELLISAGLVFALLQLPDVLDAWWGRNVIHVGGSAFFSVFIVYYVGKLVAYGLIVAIGAHFLLRGFWVAVMGLRSVFPVVNREKLDQGEIYRKFYDERLMTLDELEGRVDRIAASIFAFVFLFLLMFVMLAVWAGVAWAIALVVTGITGNEKLTGPVMIAVFVVYVGLQSFAATVDRMTKKRPVSPGLERAALRVTGWFHYISFNFLYAPVFFTFASHSSKRKMTALLIGFMYSMIAFFMLSILYSRGVIGFDSYVYYPAQAREQQLRPQNYDNLRDAGTAATEPSIQADVVEGPYVRLFIPYDAREDNERMGALCPEVAPLRKEGFFFSGKKKLPPARVAQLASCFDKVYQVAIDGQPVGKPGFVFYRHPGGHVAGRLALLPATSLPPGQHLLTVRHTTLPGKTKEQDEDADEFFIPFWR